MESRFLAGSEKLFKTFADKFRHQTQSRYRSLFEAIEAARRKERLQFGETVYLLEPNIKRSRGGLRDLQLLRWLGFARHGTTDPESLQLLGAISKDDQRDVRDATEFLLRLRNELHFHGGKSNDVLDRAEQVRLAPLYGHQGTDGILPVEQFMGRYFRHTRAVRSVVGNFVANWRPRSVWLDVWGTIFSHRVDGDYRVTPKQIAATPRGLAKLKTDLSEVLRLCELANLHDIRIAPATWEAVRAAAPKLKGEVDAEDFQAVPIAHLAAGAAGRIAAPAARTGSAGKNHSRVHPRALPAAVQRVSQIHRRRALHPGGAAGNRVHFRSGRAGPRLKGIKHKRTLHLALLIHDLGKGFVEDHSEVGLRIAEETAQRLRLPLREAETLKFLVHKHLLMSHLAFWRDTSDDQARRAVCRRRRLARGARHAVRADGGRFRRGRAGSVEQLEGRGADRSVSAARCSTWRATRRPADTAERLERAAPACEMLRRPARCEWTSPGRSTRLPHAYASSSPPERIAAELRDAAHAGARRSPRPRVAILIESHTRRIRRRHARSRLRPAYFIN